MIEDELPPEARCVIEQTGNALAQIVRKQLDALTDRQLLTVIDHIARNDSLDQIPPRTFQHLAIPALVHELRRRLETRALDDAYDA